MSKGIFIIIYRQFSGIIKHLTNVKCFASFTGGGERWIRTIEVFRQQIYSLPPLATRESLRAMEPAIGIEPTTY